MVSSMIAALIIYLLVGVLFLSRVFRHLEKEDEDVLVELHESRAATIFSTAVLVLGWLPLVCFFVLFEGPSKRT